MNSVLINILIIVGILIGTLSAASIVRDTTNNNKNGVKEKKDYESYSEEGMPIWGKCVGCNKKNESNSDVIIITTTESIEIIMEEKKNDSDVTMIADSKENEFMETEMPALNVTSTTEPIVPTKKTIETPISLDDRFLFQTPFVCPSGSQNVNGVCRTAA